MVAGGGEKNGIKGIVVGILGIEGMLGRGGNVNLGRVGIVGILGSGGNAAGFGKDGCVVGNVGCGSVGMEGKGGNCNRWRAARPTSMEENVKATKKATMIPYLLEAIL